MIGTVKIFGIQRGFGFITGEDNQDYYIHYSDILSDDGQRGKVLYSDEKVEFNPIDTKKGLRATEVKVLRYAE